MELRAAMRGAFVLVATTWVASAACLTAYSAARPQWPDGVIAGPGMATALKSGAEPRGEKTPYKPTPNPVGELALVGPGGVATGGARRFESPLATRVKRWFERTFVKGGVLHAVQQQTLSCRASAQPLVFVHVPRTAGDSIRQ